VTRTSRSLVFVCVFILSVTTIGSIGSQAGETKGKYADVNGLKMYYEIHGTGEPLVLLHGAVCTFTDDRGEEPRPQGEPHAPDECEAHTWKFLDKRYGELYREWAAAAGLCPELAKHQPWAGTLLVTELERPNRRGRPALKHPWYDLATAFKLTTMKVNQDVPRGIFPALARCLSAPWFGLSFSAKELKTRTREIEADLHTAHGAIRHEYSARIQWGDMVMIAVMYSKLPPAQAARRFPEAWSGRWHAVSARWLAEPT